MNPKKESDGKDDDEKTRAERRAERRAANRRWAFLSRQRKKNFLLDLQRNVKELSDRFAELQTTNDELRTRLEVALHENKLLKELCHAPGSHHQQQQQQQLPPNIVFSHAATTTPPAFQILAGTPLTTNYREINQLSLSGFSAAGQYSNEARDSMERRVMLQLMNQALSKEANRPSGAAQQSMQVDPSNINMSFNRPTILML